MSITHFSNRWLNRLYKSIAIFLVILAVLISALRLVLPYAHQHQHHLQDYINNTYNSNVLIGSLAMSWSSAGPTLIANDVSLLQTEMAEVDIEQFSLVVDFWASLRHWQLVTKDFSLNGVKILIDNTVLSESQQDINVINNIAELFLNQINRFALVNSQLIVRSETGEQTVFLEHLNWLNQGDRHLAQGNMLFEGVSSNHVIVRAELVGEQLAELSGLAYVEAHSLNITPWLGANSVVKQQISDSSVNFNAWLAIDEGLAKQLQVQLDESQITWQNEQQQQKVALLNGHIVVDDITVQGRAKLYATDVVMAVNEQALAPFSLAIDNSGEQTQAHISAIELNGVTDILPLFLADDQVNQLAKGVMLEGKLQDIYIKQDDHQYAAVADFSVSSSAYYQGIPGIDNLTGEMIYQGTQLKLNLSAENGALDFSRHFIQPIAYKVLTASVDLNVKPDRWQLRAEQIHFTSDALDVKAGLLMEDTDDSSLTMSLMANATDGDVANAAEFYPQLLMGNELIDYLNTALKKGQLVQTQVLFNGPLDQFPFNNNQGIFVVDAELVDANFKFAEDWPAINHFDANLNFTNNQMQITGRAGTLSGIDITGAQGTIADLSDQKLLVVDVDLVDTSPALITNLMNSSSLADSVGVALDYFTVEQPVAGVFNLALPLNDVDNTVASGRIDFADNSLLLQKPNMAFSQVNGSLFFENERLNSKHLQASWQGLPLQLDITGQQKASSYVTDIGLKGQWQQTDWQQYLPDTLLSYGGGALDWQGQFQMSTFAQGDFQYSLDMASDLVNFHADLPPPFDKKQQQKRQLTIEVSGSKTESIINALLDDSLNFYGVLDHQSVSFSQAHLVLGKEQMLLPTEGFHITANLQRAKFEQWYAFINDVFSSVEPRQSTNKLQQTPLFSYPAKVRGDIATLEIFGQQLHQIDFTLQDDAGWQLLEINGQELRGNIKFFPDLYQRGIDIDADFIKLDLADLKAANQQSPLANQLLKFENDHQLFDKVPPMRFRCQACSVNPIDLGKVSFNLVRNKDTELMLENFIAQRRDNKLHFQVNWLQDQQQIFTAINGDFSSKDIEREIEQLGYPSTIKDSSFDSSFSFDWQGSPFDFSWEKLNGKMSATLGEGVLDVDDEGARLLSVLSLKTLVRKLKLDFRDIFSDGMFFEKLTGDFTIDKGVVYTKNTAMKGAAGDLLVKGNTNLVTEQLDYTMSYKPNYSASLPALAWIATLNPVTFLAGVAIDGMITSQVVSEIKFEVTGDILQPNIEKIDGKTQTISVVGRDSPPTIVDNAAVKPLVVEQQVTPEIDQNNQHSDKSKQKKPIKS